jgi:hypothetical protein
MESAGQLRMKPSAHFVSTLVRWLPAASLALAFALSAGISAHSQEIPGHEERATANGEESRRATDIDGDRGLDVATVVEQTSSRYAQYTVQLQLASGAKESIAVVAPPGGLQLKMLDMTGDNVANDLILIPALVRWPLTVLLNDGHDHYTVAITGHLPDRLGSGEDRASSSQHVQSIVALLSSGSESSCLANVRTLFSPQMDSKPLFSIVPSVAERLSFLSSAGRAPPASLIKI